jgi:CO/xanthine dehydrogenase FAD-binding subunit
MALWEQYYLANDISDALQVLANSRGESCIIAGGTDLLLDLQQGRHVPVHTLVDVSQIIEMRKLELRSHSAQSESSRVGYNQPVQEYLFIGAALPLNQIVASPLVRKHAHALYEAASIIGGPQVRNTATLGGNVAHALPAADGMIALLSLDAQAEVTDSQGSQYLPLLQLFRGPGQSTLDPKKQILVGFHLPLQKPGQASAFCRIMRPQGVAIAILNMSIWLERKNNLIQDIRIALGPAGPVPKRALATEEALGNCPFNVNSLEEASQVLLAESHFRTSPHRATEEYRQRMAAYLLEEVLSTAWLRAGSEIG